MYPGFVFTPIGHKIKESVQGPDSELYLIIGTAVDGPVNIPRRITSSSEVERLFGPASYSDGYKDPITGTESGKYNGASLPLAFQQAVAAGATNIYLVRVPGYTANASAALSSKLDVQALYPGRIYNEVTISVASSGGVFTWAHAQPALKGGSYTTTFSSALTIREVIDQINGFRQNTTVYINPHSFPTILGDSCTTLGSGSFTLSGGTNGTQAPGEDYASTLNLYATRLGTVDSGTFDILIGRRFRFDACALTGIHIDDQITSGGGATSATIATDFVMFLDQASTEIMPCHGVMGVRPPNIRDEATLITYITTNLLATEPGAYNSDLRWNKAGPLMYSGWIRTDPVAGYVDMGARLSVVAGPEVVYQHPDIGSYTTMWHVGYGAFLTTFPPERAPIYRSIPGITVYGTNIPTKYAIRLAEGVGYDQSSGELSGKGGYVTLVRNPNNYNGPLVILSDVNAAARDDVFRENQIVRLTNTIQATIYAELYPYLGRTMDGAALAAMETQVENVLEGFANSRGIRGGRGPGYDFRITMAGTDEKLGVARVWLEFTAAAVLRRVYVTTAVRQ